MSKTVVIAGGGAAGFFGAICCAKKNPDAQVVILEKSRLPLAKVAISGGGRCNVTHACYDPKVLVTHYPRGSRELLGPFHRWQPRDMVEWFESRGVPLKTEEDGRIFPVSDQSSDVVECLVRIAKTSGVEIRMETALEQVETKPGGGFALMLSKGEALSCDRLMLATGGNIGSRGFRIAESLGHVIEPLAPSLFTFHIADDRLRDLQGLSVPNARVEVREAELSAQGPVLITHWGLSGPAILRLSAWGARELAEREYKFVLHVDWIGGGALARIKELKKEHGRKLVRNVPLDDLPQRLWESLVAAAGIADNCTWAVLGRDQMSALAEQVGAGTFMVTGKSLFKEEFVTCGGVRLSEVDFRTMESKMCPGLYFGGELLDIDGITGGFNLQAAWTTGHIAGEAMGERD